MIICIEGGDAVGKATQAKLLASRLDAKLFSFPDYSTPTGKIIRRLLTEEGVVDVFDRAIILQSLMTTNRLELAEEIGRSKGYVVLDRYDVSGIVYGSLEGLDPKWLMTINSQLPAYARPDIYFLIDIPTDESFKRRPDRRDRYERDHMMMTNARISYLKLFAEMQKNEPNKWKIIDGSGSVEEVNNRIWDEL